MKTILIAVAAVLVVAAGAFAWQRHQSLAQTKAELARVNSELQRTRSDLQAARGELATLQRQAAEQKLALDQLQADLSTARAFLEAEKGIGARLRDELLKAKEERSGGAKARTAKAKPAPGSAR
jgi:septal ring factor EnvC (AmiA/AmiB activator)